MSHRRPPDRFNRPEPEPSPLDRSVLNQLSERAGAPDFTRTIMARLGYMQVSPQVARRRLTQRWAGRAGTLLAAAVALAVGVEIYRHSPMARRAADTTLPAAIGRDLQRHHNHVGSVIQTIRMLAPAPRQAAPEPLIEPDAPPPVDDDVNRSVAAAMRWV